MKVFKFCILSACIMIVGCGGPMNYRTVSDEELDQYMASINGNNKYREYYRNVLSGGERDAVINYHGLAMAALNNLDYDVAASALDEEIYRIELVYADNPTAKMARSKFNKEALKNFKGEPYERALVFLKRGLLYLYEDDYENARAMFESGLLQDSLADNTEYTHDYAALEFLSGWSSFCNGDDGLAEESFKRVLALNNEISIPGAEDNFLLYKEIGYGPKKIGVGEYKEMLKFQDQLAYEQRNINGFEYRFGENIIMAQPMEDIFWQATTRGGREIDLINEGKAVFKENTEEFADTMIDVAAAASYSSLLTDNSDMANLGAASAALGLVSMFMSAQTKPAADLRTIHTPGLIFIGTGKLNARNLDKYDIEINLITSGNNKEKYSEIIVDQIDFDNMRFNYTQNYYSNTAYGFMTENRLISRTNQKVSLNQPLQFEILSETGEIADIFVLENTAELIRSYQKLTGLSNSDDSLRPKNCGISF